MRQLLIWFLVLVSIHAAHAATVRGILLSPDGGPVRGATVWAAASGRFAYSEKDGSLRRLTSDENGSFAFEIPDGARFGLARVLADGFAVSDFVLKRGDNKLRLKPAITATGSVQDGDGKPVANARLRLALAFGLDYFQDDLEQNDGDFLSSIAFSDAVPPTETRSDADGKWRLEVGEDNYILLDDERFAWAVKFARRNAEPLTFVAQPAATLEGRILTPDGKPLAGVFVDAKGLFCLPPRTDENGRFVLKNLPEKPYLLSGIALDTEWLLPYVTITAPLKPGEFNQAPPWTATRGVEVTGQVMDKNGGAPVEGILVLAGRQRTRSGADGRFRLRIIPGRTDIVLRDKRYLHTQKEFTIPAGVAPFDAGRIQLRRAVTVTGSVVDENGAPLPGCELLAEYAGEQWPGSTTPSTGDDGTFSTKVPLGEVKFTAARGGKDEFELIPKETKITASENTPPLQLKAKKLPTIRLGGRVVRPNGAPVPFASVRVRAEMPGNDPQNGPAYAYKLDTTTAEGRFTVAFLPGFKNVQIESITKRGFRLKSMGTAKQNKDDWQFGDSVIAALNATVSGRVVDDHGAPLAGALVMEVSSERIEPQTTNADGRFTLKNLPEDSTEIMAAHGRNFARATAAAGADVQIAPQAPGPFIAPMQKQFFEQLPRYASIYNWTAYWEAIGADKLLSLSLQTDGALPRGEFDIAKADWGKAGSATLTFLHRAIAKDPAWLRANALTILSKLPSKPGNAYYESQLAAFLARSGDAKLSAWADAWLTRTSNKKNPPADTKINADHYFRMAAVAGALNRPDANHLVLAALQSADAADAKVIENYAYTWGMQLAPGGPQLFAPIENEWPAKVRLLALRGAIEASADFDIEIGRQFLEKYQTLRAATPREKNEEDDDLRSPERTWRRAQAKREPLAALEWAEKQKNFDWEMRTVLSRELLKRGDTENAKRTLRPALEADGQMNGNAYRSDIAGQTAYFAALLKPYDAALSAQLLEKSKTESNRSFWRLSADGAYFLSFDDPARARLLLENTWQKSLTSRDPYGHAYAMNAAALIALDPVRAIELLNRTPDADYAKNNARIFIAAYLLADETARPTLHADGDY